jgi:hypothetical protein
LRHARINRLDLIEVAKTCPKRWLAKSEAEVADGENTGDS